ncbi:MAG TPA: hypothetical protein VFM18_16795 [Methanosarcina sp.]|nr:hypothetical protein [Methanosarcina sp.]
MNTFELDPAYFTSIPIHKEWGMFDDKESLTDEELLKVIEGKDRCSMHSDADHPEFAALREKLGELGFIKIQRSWWNGDRVLKPFYLNGARFEVGEQFGSAFPCGNTVKYKLQES